MKISFEEWKSGIAAMKSAFSPHKCPFIENHIACSTAHLKEELNHLPRI
jgi:hypothetical protein